MILRFYFYSTKDDEIFSLNPLPDQLDSSNISYDYESIAWAFSKKVLTLPKEQNTVLLCEVDKDTSEIINILEEHSSSFFVNNKKAEEVRKFNTNAFNRIQENLTCSYTKPEDLFISNINWILTCTAIDEGIYPLVIGPKASGKTTLAFSIAKATKRNFIKINCGSIFKPKQTLVGTLQAKEGTTFLVASKFLTAFSSTEPTLIFLDELSRIPPAAANYMMTILDPLQSYIYIEEEGKDVERGKDVIFIAAANFGYEYVDTRSQDGAFIDRFIKIMLNYLKEDEEVEMIMQRVSGVKKSDILSLVKKANLCRENRQTLKMDVSPRQLIMMAKFLKTGISLSDVITNLFINLFVNGTIDCREEVEQILNGTM